MELLKVENLHVSFRTYSGSVQAIRGISFALKKGETLAIVGESGSGKSITAKTILGLLPQNGEITEGKISFSAEKNGNKEVAEAEKYEILDLVKLKEKEFQKIRGSKIAMIFQDPMTSLNPVVKVGKQIIEGIKQHMDISKEEAQARAINLLKEVGIKNPNQIFNSFPHQLSGGMRQRIVIAIALSSEPDLLIADEPTTALDVTIQAQILELIKKIQNEREVGVIFITHDLGVVANVATKVAVMYAGKILEYGTADEVFYNPQHPYTWGLLASMPETDWTQVDGEDNVKPKLLSIPGTPPNMLNPPIGDAFALRSSYALKIDFEKEPPFFKVSDTHYAATWLLHPDAPEIDPPRIVKERIERYKRGEDE